MIGIVDYGAGNLRSVQKALEALGRRAIISGDAAQLDGCERLILPGVGSFGAGMAQLKARVGQIPQRTGQDHKASGHLPGHAVFAGQEL